MGYQAISVFTLLSQVIIKLFCSSLCIYYTTSNSICQLSRLDVSRLILSNLHNESFTFQFSMSNFHFPIYTLRAHVNSMELQMSYDVKELGANELRLK